MKRFALSATVTIASLLALSPVGAMPITYHFEGVHRVGFRIPAIASLPGVEDFEPFVGRFEYDPESFVPDLEDPRFWHGTVEASLSILIADYLYSSNQVFGLIFGADNILFWDPQPPNTVALGRPRFSIGHDEIYLSFGGLPVIGETFAGVDLAAFPQKGATWIDSGAFDEETGRQFDGGLGALFTRFVRVGAVPVADAGSSLGMLALALGGLGWMRRR